MSDNKRTICLLNDSFPPTIDGVANVVVNYARIIEKNHAHVMVATPHVPGCDDSSYDFPVVRYPSIDTRDLIGYVAGYPFSPETAHMAEKEHVGLLHTHCPMSSAILAKQLAESMDLPLVMTWHTKYDIDIANAIRSKLMQEAALQALLHNVNACDEIWTVSKGAGENLRSLGYEGKYIVMPNGVDLPHGTADDKTVSEVTGGFDLPRGIPCYLFVGRMMWYKGLRIILDALAKLKESGNDFRMVFVGSGGDFDEVISYAAELALDDKVIFTGAISDRDQLKAWYTRADLFLFPSTFDTNGLVVREAASSDTAAVIVAGSCAAEGVTDGRNGFLIDGNADSLASKLTELSGHPDAVKNTGIHAGSELYISWDDAVAKAYERYNVVTDNYKRGVYGRKDPLTGSWMQSQGELMQILGGVSAAGRTILEGAEKIRQEAVRTLEEKSLERVEELTQSIVDAKAGLTDSIRKTGSEIWEHLERYL